MRKSTKRSSDAFAFLSVAGVGAILLFVSFRDLIERPVLGPWEGRILDGMLLYLFFIAFRAVALVVLSFADRFFRPKAGELKEAPLVSVLVPCFNEEAVVQKAIASVLRLDYPNYEVLVVDDGSTDLTLLQAKEMERAFKVRVIYQKNQGKAEALNRGLSEALGEYVLCIDADSMLEASVLRNGVLRFQEDPRIAAVAGSVQVGNGHNLITWFQRLEYIVGLNFHKTAQSFLSCVTIVPGPVGLFRTSVLRALGGYRSNTFAEDCDLTLRLLMHGYRVVYGGEMKAVTEAPDDFSSLLKQRYRWSRGTIQAIKANAYWLLRPWRSLRNFSILFYFATETLFIPSANFLFAFVFIQHAAQAGSSWILGPYFLQLVFLDVLLSVYSVFWERGMPRLVLLSAVNRLTYGLSMEVVRFVSMLDELLGLPMHWNKLQRRGL